MNDSKSVALYVLLAEHRALIAVFHNLQSLLRRVREGKASIDYGLMLAMVHYIDASPDQQHRPKEDDWLFRRLRLRTSAGEPIVSRLQAEHQAGPISLGEVRRQLGNAEAGVNGSIDCLQACIDGYAERTRAHLRAEETEVLPRQNSACLWRTGTLSRRRSLRIRIRLPTRKYRDSMQRSAPSSIARRHH